MLTLGTTLTACGKTEETQKAAANSSHQTILAEPFTVIAIPTECEPTVTTIPTECEPTEAGLPYSYVPKQSVTEKPKQAATEKPTKAKRSATYTLSGNTLKIKGKGSLNERELFDWARENDFSLRKDVKTVVIENGITSIGDVFCGWESLISITIPDSVTEIIKDAFRDCKSLTDIEVNPDNKNYSSENGVLFNKNKTTLIYCPIKKEGKNYTVPDSVTEIGRSAFEDCDNLTTVNIPYGVTVIGAWAFSYCDNLTTVNIPDSVTEIGLGAFKGCKKLTDITMSNNITVIDEETFCYCEKLNSIAIPEGVTEILYHAFFDCKSLTSIYIPASVTYIGGSRYLHGDNFDNLCNLENIEISPNNNNYSSENGVLFDKNKTKLIRYPEGKKDKIYTIPDGVTKIGGSAFRCCDNLTTVNIPYGVTKIGGEAFAYCDNLTTVNIPDSVTEIWDSAFEKCPKLTNINLPAGCTKVRDEVFWGDIIC